jgi:hypothetical protein
MLCLDGQDLTALAPIREAAQLIAAKSDWGPLYDLAALAKSPVRTASATYYEASCCPSKAVVTWLRVGAQEPCAHGGKTGQ